VFAALLAAEGMTGPDKAIDGSHGVRELLGKFELGEFGGNGRPFQLPRADLKYFLTEFHSQSPITAAIELRRQVAVEDIEAVTVHTYWFAWSEIGSEPEKWHPTTRESADHSLPYILAAVLIDGRFSDDIFSDTRIRDRRILDFANRIAVKEDKEYSRQFPGKIPCRIEVRTKSGKDLMSYVSYPRGHSANPMTDEEVSDKFRMLACRKLNKEKERALEVMWEFERAASLDPLFESVRIGRSLLPLRAENRGLSSFVAPSLTRPTRTAPSTGQPGKPAHHRLHEERGIPWAHSTAKCNGQIFGVEENLTRS
jgi:2-methylcitrate dehydratase